MPTEAAVMLDAATIHSALAGAWPSVLEQLGIPTEFLRNKHGPCPVCGGKDRYRFDDRDGRGDFICNRCGAGDGFRLLELFHGWDFAETLRRVIDAAALRGLKPPAPTTSSVPRRVVDQVARPTARVKKLLRESTTPDAVADVIEYLRSRRLWPLPPKCTLRAHASAEYWDPHSSGKRPTLVGRNAALVAQVRDLDDELVTVHVTYLCDGRKLTDQEPRKLLGRLVGRHGCSVRLLPLNGDTLGIAEGIETALAAHALHDMPVWAALNTSLLAKWEAPPGVHRVVVFADRDVPGLEAALKLTARLDGRATVETRTPPASAKDWADVLAARKAS